MGMTTEQGFTTLKKIVIPEEIFEVCNKSVAHSVASGTKEKKRYQSAHLLVVFNFSAIQYSLRDVLQSVLKLNEFMCNTSVALAFILRDDGRYECLLLCSDVIRDVVLLESCFGAGKGIA